MRNKPYYLALLLFILSLGCKPNEEPDIISPIVGSYDFIQNRDQNGEIFIQTYSNIEVAKLNNEQVDISLFFALQSLGQIDFLQVDVEEEDGTSFLSAIYQDAELSGTIKNDLLLLDVIYENGNELHIIAEKP